MRATLFSSFPILTTPRLTLRQLAAADAHDLYVLRTNEAVNRFIDRPIPRAIDEVDSFIKTINRGIAQNEWLYWAIILKKENQLAGTICLWQFSPEKNSIELGYELLPQFQGKGIMQEAFEIVVDYGFHHLHLQSMEAYTHRDNTPSITFLERNGFRRTGKVGEDPPLEEFVLVKDVAM